MRRPHTWSPLFWLLGAAAGFVGVALSGLRLNLTPSLPLGVYLLTGGPIENGTLVAVCLPEAAGREGLRRGYLRPGSCLGGFSPVLKRVGAGPGETVTVTAAGVFVGGVPLQEEAPETDRWGRLLTPLPPGTYTLSSGEAWLYTPARQSWDSRYFGPVPRQAVLGTVKPWWICGTGTERDSVPRFGAGR